MFSWIRSIVLLVGFSLVLASTSQAAGTDVDRIGDLEESLDIIWVLAAAAIALMMQAGFMCVESGLVRAKNSINVAVKNVLNFLVAISAFWLAGFGLMFGESSFGIVGGSWFAIVEEPTPWISAVFVFQAVFCGTAATIVSGAVSERMRLSAYLAITVITTTVFYPIFGHWVWGSTLYPGQAGWLESLGFIDFAGSTVVHAVGGWVALAATIVVGPQLGRFDDQGSSLPVQPHSLLLVCLGTVLLLFGWLGFNCGSTLSATPKIAGIAMRTLLAASAGGLVSMTLSMAMSGTLLPKPQSLVNGILAGLVAISAGCASVNVLGAVCIGAVGSIAAASAFEFLARSPLVDDAVGVISVHAVGGAVGTVATALFMTESALAANGLSRWDQLGTQCLGTVIAFLWTFPLAYILIRILNRFHPLRVSVENEILGLNVAEHGAISTHLDLAGSMRDMAEAGDYHLASKVEVETGTELGDLATSFNRMIEEVIYKQARMIAGFEYADEGILTITNTGLIETVNPAIKMMFQCERHELIGQPLSGFVSNTDVDSDNWDRIDQWTSGNHDYLGHRKDGSTFPVEVSANETQLNAQTLFTVIIRNMSERVPLEIPLAQARKMEAVGQLAAGIAHEINTPIQYIGENVKFLQESFTSLDEFFEATLALLDVGDEDAIDTVLIERIRQAVDHAEISYLRDEMPVAITQSIEGITRVATIVQSMKDYSHPGSPTMMAVDLNRSIQSTLTVAEGEWKNVAKLETDFDEDLPPIMCLSGELNQAILNLVVNAAHAIGDQADGVPTKLGTISVGTRQVDNSVEIRVADSGHGISEKNLKKIFDPFFTTKAVGKGTGQGLALTYRIIVENHGGTIQCDSQVGVGTTFTICISIHGRVNESSVSLDVADESNLAKKTTQTISGQTTFQKAECI